MKKITPSSPEYYSMDREQMQFDDHQTLLHNYRGFASPRQYSVTQITNIQFMPFQIENYSFHLNFYDKKTKRLIEDDVPTKWKNFIDDKSAIDPLGSNFRPNTPSIMVTQDEKWQPNKYSRQGTYHKEYAGEWVTFSATSETSVSYNHDEVFIKLEIRNRNSKPLEMTLIPQQKAQGMSKKDLFTVIDESMCATVSSSIDTVSEQGFEIVIEPGMTKTYYFAVQFYGIDDEQVLVYQEDISKRIELSDKVTREKLEWAYNQLPKLESANSKFQEYYYRCMLSVMMSRYENPKYVTDVFWACGIWQYSTLWDCSFTADILAMLDPKSLKTTIISILEATEMKSSYLSWEGTYIDIIYIQKPFALQTLLEAYIRQTGDKTIFSTKAGKRTVWEWLKEWVIELQTNYTNKKGLIDVGYSTEKIIELRTDGYNHVVPITNALTIKLLDKMADWAHVTETSNEVEKYRFEAKKLRVLVDENLWNEDDGWYDNLYPDGTKDTIWTYHLFDILNADFLTDCKACKLITHLQEGEFLGQYGIYSMSRRDEAHWDLIDSDFGGGGQYTGMIGRISRNLYERGFSGKGWDLLRRHMRYIEHFPYFPQNPRIDSPDQDRSAMPLQISAGAGMEAIIFGVFGVQMKENQLVIKPFNHEDIGEAKLTDIMYQGNRYGVCLEKKRYSVYKDNQIVDSKFYGESVVIDNN